MPEILNPLEPRVVQTVFGEIMTVLIALEFNHTLRYSVAREQSIIQAKTVLHIAIWCWRAGSSSWISP